MSRHITLDIEPERDILRCFVSFIKHSTMTQNPKPSESCSPRAGLSPVHYGACTVNMMLFTCIAAGITLVEDGDGASDQRISQVSVAWYSAAILVRDDMPIHLQHKIVALQ